MVDRLRKIIKTPRILFFRLTRYISDYLGSRDIENFSHLSSTIRTFKDSDLNDILEIYKKCFRDKNFEQIVKYSVLFKNTFYVYELEGKIIGYIGYYIHRKYYGIESIHEATIYSFAVDTVYHEKGYGSILLKESIAEMKYNGVSIINLYVNIKNNGAVNLYNNNGFIINNLVKDTCGMGNVCYQMRLDIK